MALHRLSEDGFEDARVLRLMRLYDETCLALCEGQFMDIWMSEHDEWLSVEAYFDMIGRKTAALIAGSAEAGAILATDDEVVVAAYRRFGWSLGLAFQLNDDLLGIWGDEAATGKEASDIATRKKTLPLIYALEEARGPDAERLRDPPRDPGRRRHAGGARGVATDPRAGGCPGGHAAACPGASRRGAGRDRGAGSRGPRGGRATRAHRRVRHQRVGARPTRPERADVGSGPTIRPSVGSGSTDQACSAWTSTSGATMRTTWTVRTRRPSVSSTVMRRPSTSTASPDTGHAAAHVVVDEPADRVELLLVVAFEPRIEMLEEVIHVGAPVDPRGSLAEGHDHRLLLVVLVLDLAHDLLDEVLDGDEAGRAAVLVEDDGDMDAPPLQAVEEVVDEHRLGHEQRGAQEAADGWRAVVARRGRAAGPWRRGCR